MINLDGELIVDAIDALRDLAAEAEERIAVEYPEDMREQYPMYQRKYERDMALPRQGRHVADTLERRFINARSA